MAGYPTTTAAARIPKNTRPDTSSDTTYLVVESDSLVTSPTSFQDQPYHLHQHRHQQPYQQQQHHYKQQHQH
ncbi:hypothetical protein BGZ98_009901, partial [Dissophora globulifera]